MVRTQTSPGKQTVCMWVNSVTAVYKVAKPKWLLLLPAIVEAFHLNLSLLDYCSACFLLGRRNKECLLSSLCVDFLECGRQFLKRGRPKSEMRGSQGPRSWTIKGTLNLVVLKTV